MPLSLSVNKREVKRKKASEKKENHIIPGIVYGPERKENIPVSVDEQILIKVYDNVGESGLIDLAVEGEKDPIEVLIKEYCLDPVTDRPIHVDFYQIKRGQKIETEFDINFINEAPAVKELAGILVKNLHGIGIKCLPRNLEKVNLTVDLSKLKTFEDIIYVRDLELPEEIEILANPDDVIVSVTEPAEEEEPEAAPTLEEEMDKVEVEGEKEGEEEKEGEKQEDKKGEEPKDSKAKKEKQYTGKK